MTFCGYNDTMAAGLRQLVEGMAQAMEERHAKGIPMPIVVASELADLKAMNEGLSSEDGRPQELLDGLVAINLFAQAIFTLAQPQSLTVSSFREACVAHGEEFIALVKQTEDRHQAELFEVGGSPGDTTAIRKVASWLQAWNREQQLSRDAHAAERRDVA